MFSHVLPLGYGSPGHPTAAEHLPYPSTSHHYVARRKPGIAEKIPPGTGGNATFKCMHPVHRQQFGEGARVIPALARDAAGGSARQELQGGGSMQQKSPRTALSWKPLDTDSRMGKRALICHLFSFFNFWMQLKAATQLAPPRAC